MTLTEASYWTRRLGVLFGGGFLLLVVLFTIYISIITNRTISQEVLAPDYACTDFASQFQSEKLIIPSLRIASGSEGLIEIDTPTGKLDDLPLVANAYRYDNPGPSLNAQNQAKELAKKLGFDPDKIKRRGTIEYYWSEDAFGRTLTINSSNLNFDLDVNYNNPAAFPDEKKLPTDIDATSTALSFLRGNGLLLDDYSDSEPVTTLIDVRPDGSFAMARSRAEADLIRVDLYRAKGFITIRGDLQNAQQIRSQLEESYIGYETVTDTVQLESGRVDLYNFLAEVVHIDTQKSNISVYIGPQYRRDDNNSPTEEIYGIDYAAWVVEEYPCGTYPLLSPGVVADLIVNGEASLVYLNETNGDTVVPYQAKNVSKLSVKQVQVGYLDLLEQQEFMQPVYIVVGEATFEDDTLGRFYYYIPAIDYDNLKDPEIVEEVVPTT